MRSLTKATMSVATVLLLAGCIDAPPPQDIGMATPDVWSRGGSAAPTQILASDDTVAVEHKWWKGFADPTLDTLIGAALANNKNLQIAKARVLEAEAGRQGARAALLPNISATGALSRGNQGYATANKAVGTAEIDLQATWELDLFGKNQARVRQSAALAEAADAERQAVMVSLLAEVARTYFDLRDDEEQIAITEQNLSTQQKTLDLIRAQQTGALSSGLDVERAAAQVSTTAAELPARRAARETALNHLAVLVGAPPGTKDRLLAAAQPLAPLDPQILVAAPARVLASRPDVRAAERQFAAAVAAEESATKELFPTLSLVGLFGLQESSLYWAKPWGVATNLSQPLFDFGRIRSHIDAADARQTQALLGYQETVLEALEDMENALSLYLHETKRQHDLDLAAAGNRKAVLLARAQYTAGYSGLLDLLVAQRDELEAESSLATSNTRLRKSLVAIYTAAGGGWDL
ncbi:efflux transporter outer membrane subunit [Telmatospirillum sp.]|uniref:efflux transporter outer membrane subunit n=1 Tax=Telmatospirillum sp. TaxID=2079197 RepID=UPI0028418E4C|nr:efflux transporter outer membrane subunit [Telmatospirillum sp.]MDR3435335.1 efflux transporter outer membrane subunit [Telmatospirillum sp.]